ncbi:hypothetical protein B1222_21285 [Paenibacillus larvae subsp. pulvifaciens]|nr:hypothetical protein B1222_21285 [Paenibacillus larvae subsp. pulvifaciens]AQZ48019.1 hypothetical protein B5S25_16920 [Paenibacillus larvae subsp. pulvifaciens]MBH0341078.1 hypothetical protein [Paenibacillus larvae]
MAMCLCRILRKAVFSTNSELPNGGSFYFLWKIVVPDFVSVSETDDYKRKRAEQKSLPCKEGQAF